MLKRNLEREIFRSRIRRFLEKRAEELEKKAGPRHQYQLSNIPQWQQRSRLGQPGLDYKEIGRILAEDAVRVARKNPNPVIMLNLQPPTIATQRITNRLKERLADIDLEDAYGQIGSAMLETLTGMSLPYQILNAAIAIAKNALEYIIQRLRHNLL